MLSKTYLLPIFLVLLGYLFLSGTCLKKDSGKSDIVLDTISYQLAETEILLKRSISNKESGAFYLQLHHNEQTAENATLQFIQDNGGEFLNVLNNSQRLINFKYNGEAYTIDPNRIFTPPGIQSTLKKLSKYYSPVEGEVQKFAQFIFSHIPQNRIIVAVHNNTDDRYSIEDYKQGGSLANEAEDVYINNTLDKDDFILTTDRTVFENLKDKEVNAILQHPTNVTDDGSLSVYCAEIRRIYINIEAQEGHINQQMQMLQIVKEIIDKMQ